MQEIITWVFAGPQIAFVFVALGALTAGGLLALWIAVVYLQERYG